MAETTDARRRERADGRRTGAAPPQRDQRADAEDQVDEPHRRRRARSHVSASTATLIAEREHVQA